MAPSSANNASGLLVSAGLFLTTALASQWLQHHMKKQQQQQGQEEEEISDIDDESSQERLHRRKLQRQRMRRHREQQQKNLHHSPQRHIQWKNPHKADDHIGDEERDEGYLEDDEPISSDARPVDVGAAVPGDYYKLRRLEDRLSFENLRELEQAGGSPPPQADFVYPQQQQSTSFSENSNHQRPTFAPLPDSASPLRKTTKFHHHRHHHHHRRPRHRESAVDREDDYDFLPKNSNWSHFEKYNEDDVKNGVVIPGSERHSHHFQPFSSGYDHDGYASHETLNDESDPTNTHEMKETSPMLGEGSESSGSSSEEPQFVWTEAVRRPKRATSARSEPTPGPVPGRGNSERVVTSGSQTTLQMGNTSPPSPSAVPPPPGSTGTGLNRQRSISAESAISGCSEISATSNDNVPRHHASGDDMVTSSHRSARAQYNAKIMPNKVVMVRHGQSMGNVDEGLYSTTPDNAMPLTKLGWEQARKAGQHLKNHVLGKSETVHFIVSPYARTVETFHGIVSAWCDPDSPEFASIPDREMRLKAWYAKLMEQGLTWHEDPRIREQDFGNYQDPDLIRKAKRDRHRFGVFYYRFAHGESASDVFDRVSTFLDSLWRSFDMGRSQNYVLVTHGISIRVLLARYFRYTIHQFNMLSNPRNCEMVAMGHDGHGRLRLQGRYQLHLKERPVAKNNDIMSNGEKTQEQESDKDKKNEGGADPPESEWEVDEYKFYKRLRILPCGAIRKVPIRISYSDRAELS
ncbi:mutase-like protein [Seminavis robusta]|uniref:Mutase-like protein n=1 Tax=Seminavis robusta TaxID=568900 RepID=A0A9N8HQN9_9STRA|nr:mutase-like protein [Seminavis robusta]|eukprot:Sro1003_g230050.1 mutase-like protein (746) ;mRNA; r:23606-25936